MLIIDRADYKLNVEVKPCRDFIHVKMQRWLPELDWLTTDMFLNEEEFDILRQVLINH